MMVFELIIIDPFFIIYSGQAEKGRSLGDVYFLHTNSLLWRKLFLVDNPIPRHSCSITHSCKLNFYKR